MWRWDEIFTFSISSFLSTCLSSLRFLASFTLVRRASACKQISSESVTMNGSGASCILAPVSPVELEILSQYFKNVRLSSSVNFKFKFQVYLVSQHLGSGLLSLLLVDMLHEDTLVLESVTLGLQVQLVVQVPVNLLSLPEIIRLLEKILYQLPISHLATRGDYYILAKMKVLNFWR